MLPTFNPILLRRTDDPVTPPHTDITKTLSLEGEKNPYIWLKMRGRDARRKNTKALTEISHGANTALTFLEYVPGRNLLATYGERDAQCVEDILACHGKAVRRFWVSSQP